MSEEKFDISSILPEIPAESQMNTSFVGISEDERHRFRKITAELAYYRSQKSQLEHLIKFVKAKKTLEAKDMGIKSQQEQKTWAEAHNDVLELIMKLTDVIQLESMLWGEVELFRTNVEVWRTKEASKRYEQQSY